MRFMMIVKATGDSEAGKHPEPEEFAAMGEFNDALIEAGVLLAAEGLHPSSQGARVSYGDQITVIDGPFAESKELIAGFWLITARDMDEALAWARRIPFKSGETVEIRRVAEAADFAGLAPDDLIEREESWRSVNQKPIR